MKCLYCNGLCIKRGKKKGVQRYACKVCGKTQQRRYKKQRIHGNYILYTYKNNSDGELRIEKIEYTGTASGQDPFCTVTFLYSSERKDPWREYISNRSAFHEHLLKGVKIESNGEVIRRYWFNYTYDDFASYLVEVIEEGSDGKQFNSTIINRQKDNFVNDTKKFETENSNKKKPKQIYVADITGNGKKDIFITHTFDKESDPTYEFFYSNSSDNIEHFPSGPVKAFSIYFIVDTEMFGTYLNHNTFPDKKYRGEYISSPDRDGKQHVFFILCNLYEKPNDTTWTHYFYECVFKNTKFGGDFYWINKIEYTCNKKYDVRLFSGDFHGDGSVPYFLMRTQILDDNGNELENQPYYVVPGYTRGLPESQLITNLNGAKDILIYDMNGNEKSTLIKLDSNNTSSTFYKFDENNNGTYNMNVLYSYDNLLNSKSLIGDFNGDGKTDILRKASSSYNLSINTGNGFVTVFTDIPFQQGDSAIYVGDFNGDGRSDVFIPTHNAIYLNKGYKSYQNTHPYTFPFDLKGYYHFKKHTVPGLAYHADSSYQFLIVDFNGDGKESIVYSNSNYGRLAMYSLSPKIYSPLVSNITDGLNNTVRFEYGAIFHGVIHDRGKEPKDKDITLSKMNLLAVSKLISKNGIGSNNTVSFYYKGARAHTPSRRFMGFNSITSTNLTKNIKCTNIFGYDNSCFNVYLDTTYLHLASDNTLAYSITYNNATYTFGDKRFFHYVYSTSKKNYPTNDVVNEDFQYDVVNGNLIKYTLRAALKTVDSITYIKKGKSEFKNKINRHDIIRSHNDDLGKKHTRYIIYDYDNKGNLVKTTSDLNVITDYIIDPIGLVTQQKISAPQEETFIEDYFYDEKNRFITKSTITGFGSSDYRYDNSGNLLSQTNVNKLTTKYRYDGFGRMNGVRFPEGYTSLSTYNWVSGNNDKLRFNIETVTQGGPTVKTFYDILGREVQTQTDGFTASGEQ